MQRRQNIAVAAAGIEPLERQRRRGDNIRYSRIRAIVCQLHPHTVHLTMFRPTQRGNSGAQVADHSVRHLPASDAQVVHRHRTARTLQRQVVAVALVTCKQHAVVGPSPRVYRHTPYLRETRRVGRVFHKPHLQRPVPATRLGIETHSQTAVARLLKIGQRPHRRAYAQLLPVAVVGTQCTRVRGELAAINPATRLVFAMAAQVIAVRGALVEPRQFQRAAHILHRCEAHPIPAQLQVHSDG